MSKSNKTTRRGALALGLISGAGVLAGSSLDQTKDSNEPSEKVKLITASGKVVIVDSRHFPKQDKGTRLSNLQLKEWIDSANKSSTKQ